MKNSVLWKLSAAFAGCLSLSFSAMAAVPAGTLEGADKSSVYGWVWDSDNYNHIIPVEISFYPAGSDQILKTDIIKADDYQDKLQETIGDGYHGFLYSVDWNQFEQTELHVTAYTAEDERVFLGELTYNKETHTCTLGQAKATGAQENQTAPESADAPSSPSPEGPGVYSSTVERRAPGTSDQADKEVPTVKIQEAPRQQNPAPGTQNVSLPKDPVPQAQEDSPEKDPASQAQAVSSPQTSSDTSASSISTRQGPSKEIGPGIPLPEPPKEEEKKEPEYVSLGMFFTTGYCNCQICCPSGSNLTYSETVPQPSHTISADISIFPIGTRLMIDGIIYTVEDIGSEVKGNKIDIYYATHEEALDHGVQEVEVFAVPEE